MPFLRAFALAPLVLVAACGGRAVCAPAPPGSDPSPPASLARARPRPPEEADVLLFDGDEIEGRIEREVSAAEGARILGRAFPIRHAKHDECRDDGEGDLARDRATGDIVPRVDFAANGAFTAAGLRERLYVVSVHECSATHADGYGTTAILVVRGDRLVARASRPGLETLANVVDLDGDGQDELFLVSGSSNQGYTVAFGSLVRVGNDGLETLRDFHDIYESDCGAPGEEPAVERITTLHARVVAGRAPDIRSEVVTRACGARG